MTFYLLSTTNDLPAVWRHLGFSGWQTSTDELCRATRPTTSTSLLFFKVSAVPAKLTSAVQFFFRKSPGYEVAKRKKAVKVKSFNQRIFAARLGPSDGSIQTRPKSSSFWIFLVQEKERPGASNFSTFSCKKIEQHIESSKKRERGLTKRVQHHMVRFSLDTHFIVRLCYMGPRP